MPVPMIAPNVTVTADDWWNPLATLANDNEADIAAESAARGVAVTALNNRLNSTIALNGISDLPAFKTAQDSYARGFIGEVKRAVTDTTVAGVELIMETVTATVVVGRRYKATWDMAYDTSTTISPFPQFRLRVKAGVTVDATGTEIHTKTLNAVAVASPTTLVGTWTATASGTFTFGTTAIRGTGTVSVRWGAGSQTRLLLIEDIGV